MKGALDHVARTAEGLAGFAEGFRTLIAPLDPEDPARTELRDEIARNPKFKPHFAALQRHMDSLSERKLLMLEGVDRAQAQLGECTATIAKNIVQGAALGRQLQELSQTLDPDIHTYARGMRKRAEERLTRSLYHLVKSYEYHYLKRVPDDFLETSIIDRLRNFDEKLTESTALPSEETFQKLYEVVFRDKFAALGDDIVRDLQHFRARMQNQYRCRLNAEQLAQLNEHWILPFYIVRDFAKTSGRNEDAIGARILGIAIQKLRVESADPGFSLDVAFTHSGEHVVTDVAGEQYYFRIGKYPVEVQDRRGHFKWVDDHPISWRMVYNHDPNEKATGVVSVDEKSSDEQVNAALLREYKESSNTPLLQEHRPAFTSRIVLTLDGGLNLLEQADRRRKQEKQFEVTELSFYVFFERS